MIMKRTICIIILLQLFCLIQISAQTDEQPVKANFPYRLSLKGGYHGKDNERQYGFPGGWIVNGSFRRMFGRYWSVGASAEYWQKTAELPLGGIYYSTAFHSYHFNVMVFFTSSQKSLEISIGGAVGKYTIHHSYSLNTDTDNYLSLGLIFSPEYKLYKHLSVASEISFFRLVNTDRHASLFNFIIGPSIRF
jgi:hypothetical protein